MAGAICNGDVGLWGGEGELQPCEHIIDGCVTPGGEAVGVIHSVHAGWLKSGKGLLRMMRINSMQ